MLGVSQISALGSHPPAASRVMTESGHETPSAACGFPGGWRQSSAFGVSVPVDNSANFPSMDPNTVPRTVGEEAAAYRPQVVEAKWRERWRERRTNATDIAE